jgi:hypothetical protein
MHAARWFFAGFLVTFGLVGYLTGLPLALAGLVLTALAIADRFADKRSGAWLWLVGAGFGAAILTLDDVRRFPGGHCITHAGGGVDCPASGVHEIFWTGIALIFVGALVGVTVKLLRVRRSA